MTTSTHQRNTRGLTERTNSAREDTAKKIQAAKRAIEADIEKNGGIYPFAKVITQAEICRRAGVSRMTLQKDQHRQTRDDIKAWLRELKLKISSGAKVVRRAVTERIQEYKSAYDSIAQAYHVAELEHAQRTAELQQAEGTIAQLRDRIAELEQFNAELHEQVSAGKVIRLLREHPDGH